VSLAVTALTAAGKFGLARLRQYALANEFDRLCELLARRFAALSPLGPADYAAFVESESYARALDRLVGPPYTFDRQAFIAALTPLVGPLDDTTDAAAFAELIADALPETVELAKTGDSLVRYGFAQVLDAVRGDGSPVVSLAAALVAGPLKHAGVVDEVEAAERYAAAGDPGAAAETLLKAAEQLDSHELQLAAESLRERAAVLLSDAQRQPEAADVRLRVADEQIARDTPLAIVTVRKVARLLPAEEQWRADARKALVNWPGQFEVALEAIRRACDNTRDTSEELRWVAAAVDLCCIHESYEAALKLVSRVSRPTLESNDGLALDVLEAREAIQGASAVEEDWLALLRRTEAANDGYARAVSLQRRGVVLARREAVLEAMDAYRRAIAAWARLPEYEEEAADAYYSMQAAAALNGSFPPDNELRPLAWSLRGKASTPAARAERLIFEGMRERLADRGGPDAHRAFWYAYAINRRAGSLVGLWTAAERLADLYEHAGEPAFALGFLIDAGKGKEAAKLAKTVPALAVAPYLTLASRPRWERAATLEVIAAIGRSLPRDRVVQLVGPIVDEAAREPDAWIAPQPSLVAKRALAAIALSVPEDSTARVFERLVADLGHADIDVQRASALALILGTNVGHLEGTRPVVDLFIADPYNTRISPNWISERVRADTTVRDAIRDAALAGSGPALQSLALADLIASDEELSAECETATSDAAHRVFTSRNADGLSTGMPVGLAGDGIVARHAAAETRAAWVERMLEVATGDVDPENTRAMAAEAIAWVAPALTDDEAAQAFSRLVPTALGQNAATQWDANQDHPLSTFVVRLHEPGALRVAALRALGDLAAGRATVDLGRLAGAVAGAFEVPNERVIAAALSVLADVPSLTPPVPLAAALVHPDAQVRRAALRAYVARADSLPPDPILQVLTHDPDVGVRVDLLKQARARPDRESVLATLRDDSDAYVRALAVIAT
jgi:hypothetical protein